MINKIRSIYYKYKFIFVFLLGGFASLGFPPYHIFLCTVASFYLFLEIIEGTKKKVFMLGLLFGLGHHIFILYWIAISFDVANYGGYFLGSLAVFLLCIFLSFITAVSFLFIKLFSNNLNKITYAILIIIILSISDWVKGNIFWEFPWVPISTIWAFNTLTISPFAFLGTWGYSLVTFSFIVGIYLIKNSLQQALLFILPFVLCLFLGSFLAKDNIINSSKINVRLVQPNINQSDKWDINKLDENLETLINLSLKENIKAVDLVIWPETSVPFDVNKDNKKFTKGIAEINNLIVGAVRKKKKANEYKIYNSLFLIKDSFKNVQYHDKLKLVPFGEFIPFRKFLNYKKITLGGIDFSKGEKVEILEFNKHIKILPLICYEVIFPKITRDYNKKINLIINITNDGWYGESSGPYQHLALAKIRAVQEGRFLIRVANTGISAIINYNGEIIDKIDLGKKGILDKELVLTKKNTMYSEFGDNIFLILIILLSSLFIYFKINYKQVYKHE